MDSEDSAFQYASFCDADIPRVDQACMTAPAFDAPVMAAGVEGAYRASGVGATAST
jgi:hypothetical protein